MKEAIEHYENMMCMRLGAEYVKLVVRDDSGLTFVVKFESEKEEVSLSLATMRDKGSAYNAARYAYSMIVRYFEEWRDGFVPGHCREIRR